LCNEAGPEKYSDEQDSDDRPKPAYSPAEGHGDLL
jgi:hypothetical protein